MFPKKGKIIPRGNGSGRHEVEYAAAIAAALRTELGDTHQAVKTVMRWTGASERTVKNWLAGTNGPSGERLVALVRHSDQSLEAFLLLAGREQAVAARKLVEVRDRLAEMLELIVEVTG